MVAIFRLAIDLIPVPEDKLNNIPFPCKNDPTTYLYLFISSTVIGEYVFISFKYKARVNIEIIIPLKIPGNISDA